jgi:hypothetical protein
MTRTVAMIHGMWATPAAAVQPAWQDVADAVSDWLDRTSLPLPAGKRA